MRLQHRHPRSCFSSIITQQLQQQHPLKHTTVSFVCIAKHLHSKPLPRPPESKLHSSTTHSNLPANLDIDIKKTVRQRFSVSLLFIRPRFFSPSSILHLSISLFFKLSVMGRVCFDRMQPSRPRADFLLGWIQLNQPVPDHPSVSIRDRQQSF